MIYLGSERIITNSFINHGTAEDYAGCHKSDVKINGRGKVLKVIDKYKSYEDSINYNDFIHNKDIWKDGNYYNCISITGKKVKMHYDDLGGNQVWIETYKESEKIVFRIAHLDSVLVNIGDIVDENTIIGKQGNTGLVLSNKSRIDESYGSHVHLEVISKNGKYLNPREYATGDIKTTYLEQITTLDEKKQQIKINIDKLVVREKTDENSVNLGEIYNGEIYTILDEIDSSIYTWYKIKTNKGIYGYVANKKGADWIKVLEGNKDIILKSETSNENQKETNHNNEDINKKLIFTCEKEDYYYIKLYKGEKLYLEK